jgi:asparagine synthase (glutamine-hydrolysing)
LEFAARLPVEYKVKGLTTKRILKKAFSKRVPVEIIKRKKTGFPVPYTRWFRGPLRNYVREVLFDQRSLQRGYFQKSAIENLVDRCDQGAPVGKEIFSLLTLELWHREFVDQVHNSAEDKVAVPVCV